MKSIQLDVIPHQTQEGLPYQHLHFQIMTDDGIIAPEDLKSRHQMNPGNGTETTI